MSAKSSIKLLVANDQQSKLYRWIAALTGSKNTLKGLGFFLGGTLITLFGFRGGLIFMILLLALTLLFTWGRLESSTNHYKPKFTEILSKSNSINLLSGHAFSYLVPVIFGL